MTEDLRALGRLGQEWLAVAFGALVGFLVMGAFSLYTVGTWALPGAALGGLLVGVPQRLVLAAHGQLPPGRWWLTAAGTWTLYALGMALALWRLEPHVPDLSSEAGLLALAAPASVAGALPAAIFQAWRLVPASEARRAWLLWTAIVLVVCSCLLAVLVRTGHLWTAFPACALVYAGSFVLAVRVRARW